MMVMLLLWHHPWPSGIEPSAEPLRQELHVHGQRQQALVLIQCTGVSGFNHPYTSWYERH